MSHWSGRIVGLSILALFVAFPMVPGADAYVNSLAGQNVGNIIPNLFIYAILALGLHVVVGCTGILHLGIAAFFGVGAYALAIATINSNPFHFTFTQGLLLSVVMSTLLGVILSAPLLRLKGDYLALVTLGFGLVIMYLLRNFQSITNGMQGINPIEPPNLNLWGDSMSLAPWVERLGIKANWVEDYRLYYYLILGYMMLAYVFVWNLERSRLGRAWVAIREDELAATCMGINSARAKLAALAIGAGLAGLAGGLFATKTTTTSEPTNVYNFNLSMTMICCLILGGLGSRSGALIGVTLVFGYEQFLSPVLDAWIQREGLNEGGKVYRSFSGWKLMIFGLALILMMLLRPKGILPASRSRSKA